MEALGYLIIVVIENMLLPYYLEKINIIIEGNDQLDKNDVDLFLEKFLLFYLKIFPYRFGRIFFI